MDEKSQANFAWRKNRSARLAPISHTIYQMAEFPKKPS